jgi:hypothetical protein
LLQQCPSTALLQVTLDHIATVIVVYIVATMVVHTIVEFYAIVSFDTIVAFVTPLGCSADVIALDVT